METGFSVYLLRKLAMGKETVAPMSKNSVAMALHPPYFDMIKDAISTMKDRRGSSQQAISKFIEDKHRGNLPSNFNKVLSIQLKKLVKSERLLKVKKSFKVSPTEKPKSGTKDLKKKMAAESNNFLKRKADAAKKTSEKGVKTKRLSQVKTPELMKMAVRAGERTKKLIQIKTPDVFKNKKNPTPMRKKKDSKTLLSSKPAKTGSK